MKTPRAKGRRHSPALGPPRLTLGEHEPVPQQHPHPREHRALDVVAMVRLQHVLEMVGVVQQRHGDRPQLERHDFVGCAHRVGGETGRIANQTRQRAEERPRATDAERGGDGRCRGWGGGIVTAGQTSRTNASRTSWSGVRVWETPP